MAVLTFEMRDREGWKEQTVVIFKYSCKSAVCYQSASCKCVIMLQTHAAREPNNFQLHY